jgi:hypothetical protein
MGRLNYIRNMRWSIETMDAAEEELNMLEYIFQKAKFD